MTPAFQIVVKIEMVAGELLGTKKVTIHCRDEAHAEAVGKMLANCAEQEKKIALESTMTLDQKAAWDNTGIVIDRVEVIDGITHLKRGK